jgi:hypothetical protein
MRRSCPGLILLLLLMAPNFAAQTKTKPRPSSFIESRQGNHPEGPDMIGHGHVAQGDAVICMMVEVYDESYQSSTACMIRFGAGPQHTLAFKESTPAPQGGEAYLECAGDKPRRCRVMVNPPPTANQNP